MQFFERIAQGVDVTELNRQLDAQPELWDAINLRRVAPNSPHAGMTDIWVRYNDIGPFLASGDFTLLNEAHFPVWYPAWHKLPALAPIVFGLMGYVQGQMLGGILITRIPAGQSIAPHQDDGWHVRYYRDKFYISLKAAPGARFHTEGESIEPEVGDVWRFDNRLTHWVTNDSNQERVTLIVCIHTDLWNAAPQG